MKTMRTGIVVRPEAGGCGARRLRGLGVLVLWLSLTLRGLCGGGPEGVVVVYNPSDVRSLTIANHYQQLRGIPERNLFAYEIPESFTRDTVWDFVYALRERVADRKLESQMESVALAGLTPLGSGISPLSLHSFLFLSPSYSQGSFPLFSNLSNPAYVSPYSDAWYGPAPGGTEVLSAAREYAGKRVLPVSAIGYPGLSGNSLTEILAYLDRAAAADGTRAEGTVYWPLNSNIRSTTRQSQIGQVAPIWQVRGQRYSVIGTESTGYSNDWIDNRPDVLGGIVGFASWSGRGGNVLQPGAWVDHLTSFGGSLNHPDPTQYPISMWIREGVDGSSGTVGEPGAVAAKFPHAHLHTHLRAGASLAEAFWLSLSRPAEIFCLGDPLLRPHAWLPAVEITEPLPDAEVAGQLTVRVTAAPTGGHSLEPELDLFVNGRRVAVGAATEAVTASRSADGFVVDSTTLSDGWHELRCVAYNADSVRNRGAAVVSVRVNNGGAGLVLDGPTVIDRDGDIELMVTPTGLDDLTELNVVANGRILASVPLAGGDVVLSGALAPLTGPWTLFAVGRRADGRAVWSPPLTAAVPSPPRPGEMPDLGAAMTDVKLFSQTKPADFDWDTTAPDIVTTFPGDPEFGMYLTPTNIPGIASLGTYADKPGLELNFWFYAPKEDWYEFMYRFGQDYAVDTAASAMAIGGQDLPRHATAFGPRRLAAGWHPVRARAVFTGSNWAYWNVRVRGGTSQMFVLPTWPEIQGAPSLRPANCASSGTGDPADVPTVVSVGPQSPVTTTTRALDAVASIGNGTPAELAELTYHWEWTLGPAAVHFSENNSLAAAATVATFTEAGEYVLGLRVAGPAGSVYTNFPLLVAQTPVGLIAPIVTPSRAPRGLWMEVFTCTKDQFGRRIEITGANPEAPTVAWSTDDPNGAFADSRYGGERILYRSLSSVNAAETFTITATGVNGRSGSAAKALTFDTNAAPERVNTLLFAGTQPGASGPVVFTASVRDPEDNRRSGAYPYYSAALLSYDWSVDATPPGETLALDGNGYKIVRATPSGPGEYSLRLTITDQAGESISEAQTFVVVADGAAAFLPNPSAVGDETASLYELVTFSLTASIPAGAPAAVIQWQKSVNAGADWMDIPGATGTLHEVGPVTLADDGLLFRVVMTNAAGSVPGGAGRLTVDATPDDIALGFVGTGNPVVAEDVGTVEIPVGRFGSAAGAVSVDWRIYSFSASQDTDFLGVVGSPSAYNGTLTWPDGDATDRVLTIPIVDDEIEEPFSEAFYLQLSNPTGGAQIGGFQHRFVQIEDDDGINGVGFAEAAVAVREDQGALTLTVERTSGGGPATVDVVTGINPALYRNLEAYDESALPGQDYTGVHETLSWDAGDFTDRQVTITLLADELIEGAEWFTVGLVSAQGTQGGRDDVVLVTLDDSLFQQFQAQNWPEHIEAGAVYNDFAEAASALSPLVRFAITETAGDRIYGRNAAGSTVATGTLVRSAGQYTLGGAGPRPPAWPGLAPDNTALGLATGAVVWAGGSGLLTVPVGAADTSTDQFVTTGADGLWSDYMGLANFGTGTVVLVYRPDFDGKPNHRHWLFQVSVTDWNATSVSLVAGNEQMLSAGLKYYNSGWVGCSVNMGPDRFSWQSDVWYLIGFTWQPGSNALLYVRPLGGSAAWVATSDTVLTSAPYWKDARISVGRRDGATGWTEQNGAGQYALLQLYRDEFWDVAAFDALYETLLQQ